MGEDPGGPLVLGVTWASAVELEPLVPAVLSRSEIATGLRIADPVARSARLAGRALLLTVMARELGVAPVELPALTRACQHCGGPHGRPRLSRSPVAVSLSCSGGAVAVAWARTAGDVPAPAVGLDVVDPGQPAPDPAVVLHPREQARRLDGPGGVTGPDGRVGTGGAERLWRAWARKEAVLKASGHGLAVDPASLDLGPGQPEPALGPAGDAARPSTTTADGAGRMPAGTSVRWTPVPAGGWRGMHVTDLQVGPLSGALALDRGWSPPSQVDVRRWKV